jgi:hypothetical protein
LARFDSRRAATWHSGGQAKGEDMQVGGLPCRCVYTALTGRYEKLVEQEMARQSSIPFICFTDDPDLTSATWDLRPLIPLLGNDPVRSQRDYKLRPHRFLPDYDISLYIDNSVTLTAPPETIFDAVDLSSGLSMLAHSYRRSVLDEFARVTAACLDDPARVAEQLEYYRSENPDVLKQRPFWGGIMLRDHRHERMIATMELWFAHILRFSRRDQLSNQFVFHKAGLIPQTLHLNNFKSWFHTWPHVLERRSDLRTWQPVDAVASASQQFIALESRYHELAQAHEAILGSRTWRATEPLRQLIKQVARRTPVANIRRRQFFMAKTRRLVFVLEPPADAWPSALLRGHQMMALIKETDGAVACRTATVAGLMQASGEVAVLTKSALLRVTPEMVTQLRQRGHRLIADFVDHPVDAAIAEAMHGLLASSVSQQRFFRAEIPDVPAYHVTHHVDLRLPPISPPADFARFGYFGRPENLLHQEAIKDLVGIVRADDPHRKDWMRHLAEFNAHCVLRAPGQAGAFKPFTKGFIAGHCGVPVIVGAADTEAHHYLGPHYPFVISDVSLGSVRAHLARFADAFGSTVWTAAIDTMRKVAARSGQQHVKAELRVFLDAVFA